MPKTRGPGELTLPLQERMWPLQHCEICEMWACGKARVKFRLIRGPRQSDRPLTLRKIMTVESRRGGSGQVQVHWCTCEEGLAPSALDPMPMRQQPRRIAPTNYFPRNSSLSPHPPLPVPNTQLGLTLWNPSHRHAYALLLTTLPPFRAAYLALLITFPRCSDSSSSLVRIYPRRDPEFLIMAEAVKPSSTGDVAPKVRPEKPDEEQYKADLAKAEKEHATAQEDLVGSPDSFRSMHASTHRPRRSAV